MLKGVAKLLWESLKSFPSGTFVVGDQVGMAVSLAGLFI
jgi:hypothetical protein